MQQLPYLTKDLPGIGGRLRATPEDFQVEEIPAYEPCGEGDHVYAWVEKRGMTTAFLLRELATALDIKDSDIGAAGMKDRHAVTRQMLSLPSPVTPEAVMALEIEGAKILSAVRHGNKLRTGHLRGNRFVLRICDLDCPAPEAAERASKIFERLAAVPGAPNWFGAQRFGRAGDNADVGRALVRGEKTKGRPPRGRQRRLFISAYQSKLFNEILAARLNDDLFSTVVESDVLQKRDSGGVFLAAELETEQQRFDQAELALTGPMFGHKMKTPSPGSAAALREDVILSREELTLDSFSHLRKLANGARRAMSILLEDVAVEPLEDAIEVRFSLPSGSYATAILREVIKGSSDFPE